MQIICKRHVYIKTDLDEKGSSEKRQLDVLHIVDGADATCLILMVVQTPRLNGLCLDRCVRYILENQNELIDGRTVQKYIPWPKSILESVRLTKAKMAEQRKLWRRI